MTVGEVFHSCKQRVFRLDQDRINALSYEQQVKFMTALIAVAAAAVVLVMIVAQQQESNDAIDERKMPHMHKPSELYSAPRVISYARHPHLTLVQNCGVHRCHQRRPGKGCERRWRGH